MGTRSSIGIENNDGTVDSIYCHWDGYPSHHAPILLKYYDSEEKVREIIKYGDMSSLRKAVNPEPRTHHSFNKQQSDVCVYYHRDRGEEWNDTKPLHFENITKWQENTAERFGEYLYLFKDNKWYLVGTDDSDKEIYKLQELTEDSDDWE